jgi:radical SAM-linked protein
MGVTSSCELVDIFLEKPADPQTVLRALQDSPPGPGIQPVGVEEIGVDSPSLQSQISWAEYEVAFPPEVDGLRDVVSTLLERDTLPVTLERANKVKRYDLRPLVLSLTVHDRSGGAGVLRMRLRAAPEMTARADQVLQALGLSCPAPIHRTRLEVEEVPQVLQAYRTRGELSGNGNS